MKCGECGKEAFISIADNTTIFYFCIDCYTKYKNNINLN